MSCDIVGSPKEVTIFDEDGNPIGPQHPLATDGDSIYNKDVAFDLSSQGTFTGNLNTIFGDYDSEIEDSTAANPKTITLRFKRPITSNKIGIGSKTGNFSNVEILLKDLAGTTRQYFDDSTNNTKHTSNLYEFTSNSFIEVVINFHTADTVTISGMFIPKAQERHISAIDGIISVRNSSLTPLTDDAVFTGEQEDTKNYGMIQCALFSDVACTFVIQFRSTPSSTWRVGDTYEVAAGEDKVWSFQSARRFMRVIVTNGPDAQTEFDLQTILKPVYVKPSSHPIGDVVKGNDDAELVKAQITGESPSGAFLNVKTNQEGALSVSDFLIEVARGNVAGMKMYAIPGRKNSISSAVLDDLTQIPGTTVVPSPGGIQLEIVSDNANDTSAGTGVQTLDIHYLDTNGDEQDETVTMDGTTPVNTVATDIDFVQWMHTKTVGSNTVSVGNISLLDTGGVVTYEYIAAGGNQSLSARYMVPSGKTGYITGWQSSSVVKRVDIRLRATVERFDRTIVPGVFLFQDNVVLNDAVSGWLPFDVWLKVPAGGEVKISGISAAAGGDAGGKFNILLIDD